MRVVALICSPASLVFTLLVLLTDGLSPETLYRVFTVALVLIPGASFVVLLRGPAAGRMVGVREAGGAAFPHCFATHLLEDG